LSNDTTHIKNSGFFTEDSDISMGPDDSITELRGIGPSVAVKLSRLGIVSLGDLLLHLPVKYQDRTRSVPLRELEIGQSCLVTGEIIKVDLVYGGRRSLTATIEDGSGFLTMRLFHFSPHQRESLRAGAWLRCFGDIRMGPAGLEMVHPEYRVFIEKPAPPEAMLTPVYPTTDGVTSARLRSWIEQALNSGITLAGTTLPEEEVPDLHHAIEFMHKPPPETRDSELVNARSRIAMEELLAHYLLMKERQTLIAQQTTKPLPQAQALGRELLKTLNFNLTRAQRRVISEVLTDLEFDRPMMRLLQGDVGSGKTVVAAFAAIRAAEHDQQTAIIAPTEILAEQHYETFSNWLSPLGINVGWITGHLSARERKTRLKRIACGDMLVVVGTHALFQSAVEFQALALTIVDEQHRFGVHQRMMLRHKGNLPHQLIMTATPIPRTLTMAMYADMDVSVIDELPPGRQPVATSITSNTRRAEVIARVMATCQNEGRQAYWVCTLIEESDAMDSQAAENVASELHSASNGLEIGLVHGRLTAQEKLEVMARFKNGQIDVLVATTVIEVGVDAPNASLIVIDNPERLGLSQLHQLRGRVGRGRTLSHCILLFEPPLSEFAKARLNVMRKTNDGFEIAEKDLELRGPGDILGTRQTGEQTFRIADLMRDAALITRVIELGSKLDAATKRAVINTWQIAADDKYADV
jgi:ATP-dependent DNA helicase RecG